MCWVAQAAPCVCVCVPKFLGHLPFSVPSFCAECRGVALHVCVLSAMGACAIHRHRAGGSPMCPSPPPTRFTTSCGYYYRPFRCAQLPQCAAALLGPNLSVPPHPFIASLPTMPCFPQPEFPLPLRVGCNARFSYGQLNKSTSSFGKPCCNRTDGQLYNHTDRED